MERTGVPRALLCHPPCALSANPSALPFPVGHLVSTGAGAEQRVGRALQWEGVGPRLGPDAAQPDPARPRRTQWTHRVQPELTQLSQQQKPFWSAHKTQISLSWPGGSGRQGGTIEGPRPSGASADSPGWGPQDAGLLTCEGWADRGTGAVVATCLGPLNRLSCPGGRSGAAVKDRNPGSSLQEGPAQDLLVGGPGRTGPAP